MGNCIPSKQSEDMLQGVVEMKVFLVTVGGEGAQLSRGV